MRLCALIERVKGALVALLETLQRFHGDPTSFLLRVLVKRKNITVFVRPTDPIFYSQTLIDFVIGNYAGIFSQKEKLKFFLYLILIGKRMIVN